MIRTLALILTLIGMVGLVMGVLGLFGNSLVALHPWALTILGGIFFIAGVSILKYQRDPGR